MSDRIEKIKAFLKEINEICKKYDIGMLNANQGIMLIEKKEDGAFHITPPVICIELDDNFEMTLVQSKEIEYKPLKSPEAKLIKYREFLEEYGYDIKHVEIDNKDYFQIKKDDENIGYLTKDEIIKTGEKIKNDNMEEIMSNMNYLRGLGFKTDFSSDLTIYVIEGKSVTYKSILKFNKYVKEIKEEVENGK